MTRARLQDIASLGRRRERARQGLFLVEGVRAIESALAAGAPLVEIVVSAAAAQEPRTRSLLERANVDVSVVSARDIERLSDARTSQGIVGLSRAVVTRFEPSALPHAFEDGVVLLDSVQDPGNVGTIIRTAAWFGVGAVVVGRGTADPESPKVARAAAGALWDVWLGRAEDPQVAAAGLVAAGFALYGAEQGGTPVGEWQPSTRTALVLGSEADGISPGVAAMLTGRVGIPSAGRAGVESLNVAVAAGILMHRWRVG